MSARHGLLWLVLIACGPNASERFAGLEVHEPRSGAYRVRYLAPPWEVVGTPRGDALRLEVESAAPGTSAPPKYELTVDVPSGATTPEQRARAVERSTAADDRVTGPRPLVTDFGTEGFEVIFFDNSEGRYERHVFLEREARGVIRLVFVANPDLDNLEVDDMIASVEVGPFDDP